MGVAPKAPMGLLADGSISNLAYNMSNYLCTILVLLSKSAQFGQKWQLIRSTNTKNLVYMQKTLIIINQPPICSNKYLFFSVFIYFFSHFPHPHIEFLGDLGEKWGWVSSFHTFFQSPNPNFSTFWGNGLGPQPVEYPFVTACVFGYSIRQ